MVGKNIPKKEEPRSWGGRQLEERKIMEVNREILFVFSFDESWGGGGFYIERGEEPFGLL